MSVSAFAETSTAEPALSQKSKLEIRLVLDDALKEKDLTRAQYDRSIFLLMTNPCESIDQDLNDHRKSDLETAILKQENVEKLLVRKVFRLKGWSIVYVATFVSDDAYLFYSGAPIFANHAINKWGGGASLLDAPDIEKWVVENVPGIPPQLASCFAAHVSFNRD